MKSKHWAENLIDGRYAGFYEDDRIEITSYYLLQGKESFVVYKAKR